MDPWAIVWVLLIVFVGLPIVAIILCLIIYLVLSIHTHFQHKRIFGGKKGK